MKYFRMAAGGGLGYDINGKPIKCEAITQKSNPCKNFARGVDENYQYTCQVHWGKS